jgi:hypothetical protein
VCGRRFMTLPGDPQHTDSMAPPTHAPPCVECSQFDGSVLPGYNSSTVHIALGLHEVRASARGHRACVASRETNRRPAARASVGWVSNPTLQASSSPADTCRAPSWRGCVAVERTWTWICCCTPCARRRSAGVAGGPCPRATHAPAGCRSTPRSATAVTRRCVRPPPAGRRRATTLYACSWANNTPQPTGHHRLTRTGCGRRGGRTRPARFARCRCPCDSSSLASLSPRYADR